MKTIYLERMGDFFEAFNTDAKDLSCEMGITLSVRDGMPMAGFPCHMVEHYIRCLNAAGYSVKFNAPIR